MHVLIGFGSVSLGLAASVLGVGTCAYALLRDRMDLMKSVRVHIVLVLLAAVVGVIVMESALLTHDFSVEYVANNGRRGTPVLFTIATLWGALEGSILVWTLILAGFIAVVGHRFRDRFDLSLIHI